jgi:hypothetical protein
VGRQTLLGFEQAAVLRLPGEQTRASSFHCAAGGVAGVVVPLQIPPAGVGVAARIVPLLPVQPDTGSQLSGDTLMHSVPHPKSP